MAYLGLSPRDLLIGNFILAFFGHSFVLRQRFRREVAVGRLQFSHVLQKSSSMTVARFSFGGCAIAMHSTGHDTVATPTTANKALCEA